jgi:hypothetical protein
MVQSLYPKQDGVKSAEFELATSIQHERRAVMEAINELDNNVPPVCLSDLDPSRVLRH